jgi:hypothetical protein
MSHKKRGDLKDEEYFQSNPEDHKISKGSTGDGSVDEDGEQFYSRGMDVNNMSLLEDSRFLSEGLEIIFLLMEGCDPKFPSDSEDGLTNEEWERRLQMARIFLETHEKRVLIPGVKARLQETYLKKNV